MKFDDARLYMLKYMESGDFDKYSKEGETNTINLIKLNKTGVIITFDSQEGEIIKKKNGNIEELSKEILQQFNKEDIEEAKNILKKNVTNAALLQHFDKNWYNELKTITNKYIMTKERAYIIGLMIPDIAKKVVDYINTYTDKVCFITNIISNQEYKRIKGSYYIPVTVTGTHKTSFEKIKLEHQSSLKTAWEQEALDFIKKNNKINKSEKVVVVNFFDPVYGRRASSKDGLYQDLFKTIKTLK